MGVKKTECLGEGVGVIGVAERYQGVNGVFKRIDGSDELRIVHCRIGKTDYAYTAAGAYLPARRAAGGLGYDVDKGLGAGFHVGKRCACHAAGAVEHEDDIG